MEYIKKLQALASSERKKKVPDTPGILREIGIHVLTKSKMVESVLRDVPNPFYLPILNTLTIGELKRRIRGLTAISIRQMMLVYRGTVLHDTATIPEEAFELLHPLSFFEDLYRPKVYLRVFSREAVEHEDNSDNGNDDDDHSDASDDVGALTGEAFPENYVMEEEDHVDKMSRAESAGSFMLDDLQIAKYIKEQTFDLQLELERIQSEAFFDVLHTEGYADEGAFARLTDETLSGRGLWLPRKARNRITKLAALVNNRLERQNEKLLARLKRIEEKELERQRIQAALEAGEDPNAVAEEKLLDITEEADGDIDNQADADKTESLEQEILHQLMTDDDNEVKEGPESMQQLQLLPPLPPETALEDSTTPISSRAATANKKPALSAELQKKIAAIRRAYELDKDGFYKNYITPTGVTGQPECCDKHKDEALAFHDQYAVFISRRKETDLRGAVVAVDMKLYRNGFMPRNVLRRIALLNLVNKSTSGFISTRSTRKKHRFETEEVEAANAARLTQLEIDVDRVLDQCIMDSREQGLRLQWAGERERRSRVITNAWHGQEHNGDLDGDGRSLQLVEMSKSRLKPTDLVLLPKEKVDADLDLAIADTSIDSYAGGDHAVSTTGMKIAKANSAADITPLYDSDKFLRLILNKTREIIEAEIDGDTAGLR